MNIEQMLRDAIESKTARILKEQRIREGCEVCRKHPCRRTKRTEKMKRYAIVYADGSNRRLTQTDYSSRKEAGDALIYFLTCNNASYSKDGDEYLNPFDFTLKEIEYMTWETKASKKPRRYVRRKKHEI